MNKNFKNVKKRRGVEVFLGSLKTETESRHATLVTLNNESVEFLAHEGSEAQKILKLSNTTEDITYLMDDDGNYYFHTSDADEDIGEIEKEVFQIKQEPEANEATKARRTSILEKVKSNLSKRNNKNKMKINSCSTSTTEDTTDKTTSKKSTAIKEINQVDSGNDDTIGDDELLAEIYEFNENDEGSNDSTNSEKDEVVLKQTVRLKPAANNELLRCAVCPYTTPRKFLLSRHMKSHTNEKPFKCSICERGFKSNASLLNHVNTHLGKKPHSCKECPSSFTTTGELMRHTRYKHTGEKPHKCSECDYASVELSKLRRHMRCHTGERPYQCPHCTYASPDTFKLKRHMRTHTGEKPYECDICQARFTQSNSLKAHRLIHSVSDKPVFQCSLCPTTCGRKTDLRLHILKIHNSDKPIKCKRCGKELPDRYSYKLHIKTHQGEKCYRCKLCPYAAVLMRHLETHMLIHTDEKPFTCEICDQRFRQRQLLKRHINLYHNKNYVPPVPRAKEHACPHCKRSFANKGNLIRHMEMHDPNLNANGHKHELIRGRVTKLEPNTSIPETSMDFSSVNEEEEEIYDDPDFDDNHNESDENFELIDEHDEDYCIQDENGENNYDTLLANNIKQELTQMDRQTTAVKKVTSAQVDTKVAIKTINIKNIKKESDGKEYISVAGEDGQEYMILEVTQSDEEGDDHADNDDDGVDESADIDGEAIDLNVQLEAHDPSFNVMETVDENVEYEANNIDINNIVTIKKIQNVSSISPANAIATTKKKEILAKNIIELEGFDKQFLEIIEVDE